MSAREDRDTFAYLEPLVRAHARRAARQYGGDFEEWLSRSWRGALSLVGEFDAERSVSLWGFVGALLQRRIVDEFRADVGRSGRRGGAEVPVGLFQEKAGSGGDEEDALTVRMPGVEDRGFVECEAAESVRSILRDVSERSRDLLRWHYIEGRPLEEFGRRAGVTGPAVSGWHRAALLEARAVAEAFEGAA